MCGGERLGRSVKLALLGYAAEPFRYRISLSDNAKL